MENLSIYTPNKHTICERYLTMHSQLIGLSSEIMEEVSVIYAGMPDNTAIVVHEDLGMISGFDTHQCGIVALKHNGNFSLNYVASLYEPLSEDENLFEEMVNERYDLIAQTDGYGYHIEPYSVAMTYRLALEYSKAALGGFDDKATPVHVNDILSGHAHMLENFSLVEDDIKKNLIGMPDNSAIVLWERFDELRSEELHGIVAIKQDGEIQILDVMKTYSDIAMKDMPVFEMLQDNSFGWDVNIAPIHTNIIGLAHAYKFAIEYGSRKD